MDFKKFVQESIHEIKTVECVTNNLNVSITSLRSFQKDQKQQYLEQIDLTSSLSSPIELSKQISESTV